ncbi:glycerophosphodiester phosphodiesterase family protein [Sphingobacterium sp. MYb382]|uniref:glycerophosphodiester phosphodiesterase family protein n=1 Tax=Sphingobacterium sp. MYb382 TaxID=2745278 RepID=UPI0030B7C502
MKRIFFLGFLLTFFTLVESFAQHRLAMESTDDLVRFFTYVEGKKIISGHRGTMEQGMPENSIAAMEAVLAHTPAFFEIDPRYTKDSVIIVHHDATLERTTTGKGKVADYTYVELQKLKLKDASGNETPYRLNTLDEMIAWAKGKTILNLDKKDVPLEATAAIIRKHQAYAWVMVTVHNIEQARFFLTQNPKQFLAMHIRTAEQLEALKASGLPLSQMLIYIGPKVGEQNKKMYAFFHAARRMCMLSGSSSYDKLGTAAERADMYRAVYAEGATIFESDRPIEVAKAIGE